MVILSTAADLAVTLVYAVLASALAGITVLLVLLWTTRPTTTGGAVSAAEQSRAA